MFQRILLGIIALCMLLYLLPTNVMLDLTLMVIIAICLIAVLALRAKAWYNDESSIFDMALIIGASVALVHLFTFSAFDRSLLSFVTSVLFATFFGLLAGLMRNERIHESVSARTHNPVPTHNVSRAQQPSEARHKTPHHINHALDPKFMRGIEPIPERAPPHHVPKLRHRVRAAVRHVFRPRAEPLHELHSAHVEPLKEVTPPTPGKRHDDSFKRGSREQRSRNLRSIAPEGIEPIHEITPAHLHKLGVYDVEKRK